MKKSHLFAAVLACLPSPAAAQPLGGDRDHGDEVEAVIDWVYDGVSPGSANNPPRIGAIRRAMTEGRPRDRRLLTWPGFQEMPGGGSRFFVQTSAPVTTEGRSEPGRFTVLLRDTRIMIRNNRRPLETAWFNTPATRARIERRGRDVAFILDLRADVTPNVSTEPAETGFHFVMIEFPPGSYLSDDVRRRRLAPPGPDPDTGALTPTEDRPGLAPELEELDDERPPSFQ